MAVTLDDLKKFMKDHGLDKVRRPWDFVKKLGDALKAAGPDIRSLSTDTLSEWLESETNFSAPMRITIMIAVGLVIAALVGLSNEEAKNVDTDALVAKAKQMALDAEKANEAVIGKDGILLWIGEKRTDLMHRSDKHRMSKDTRGIITGDPKDMVQRFPHAMYCPDCFPTMAELQEFVIDTEKKEDTKEPEKEEHKTGRLENLNKIADPAQRSFIRTLYMEAAGEEREDWFHGLEGWSLPLAEAIVYALEHEPEALAQNMRSGNDLPDLQQLVTDRLLAEEAWRAARERGENPPVLPEFNLLLIARPEVGAILLSNEGHGGEFEHRLRAFRNFLDPIFSVAPRQLRGDGTVSGFVSNVTSFVGRLMSIMLATTYGVGAFILVAFVLLGVAGFAGVMPWLAIAIFVIVISASGLYVAFGEYFPRRPWADVTETEEVLVPPPDGQEGPPSLEHRPVVRRRFRSPFVMRQANPLITAITKLIVIVSVFYLWSPVFAVCFAAATIFAPEFSPVVRAAFILAAACAAVWEIFWRVLDSGGVTVTRMTKWAQSFVGERHAAAAAEAVGVVHGHLVGLRRSETFRRIVFAASMIFYFVWTVVGFGGFGGLEMEYVRFALIPGLLILAGSYIVSGIQVRRVEDYPVDRQAAIIKRRERNERWGHRLVDIGAILAFLAFMVFVIVDPLNYNKGQSFTKMIRDERVQVMQSKEVTKIGDVASTTTNTNLNWANRKANQSARAEVACEQAENFLRTQPTFCRDPLVQGGAICVAEVECGLTTVKVPETAVDIFLSKVWGVVWRVGLLALIVGIALMVWRWFENRPRSASAAKSSDGHGH